MKYRPLDAFSGQGAFLLLTFTPYTEVVMNKQLQHAMEKLAYWTVKVGKLAEQGHSEVDFTMTMAFWQERVNKLLAENDFHLYESMTR